MASDQKNLHAGHREKLKNRFLSEGLNRFEDHQVLELILFFAIPRKDVNEIAHLLLNEFGSLSGVFEASVEDLRRIDGVGEHSAMLLKTYPAVAKSYYRDRFRTQPKVLDYNTFGEQLMIHFAGFDREEVVAMFFNNSLSPCGSETLHRGDINSAGFSMRRLADAAVLHKASFVILAHNHPHGVPVASGDDLHTTGIVKNFLAQMNVVLIDHFIIAEGRFTSVDKDNFDLIVEEFKYIKSRRKKKMD